jgi:hypothetical protein
MKSFFQELFGSKSSPPSSSPSSPPSSSYASSPSTLAHRSDSNHTVPRSVTPRMVTNQSAYFQNYPITQTNYIINNQPEYVYFSTPHKGSSNAGYQYIAGVKNPNNNQNGF